MTEQSGRGTPCCNSPYWHGCMTGREATRSCPEGHGVMEQLSDTTWECPTCGSKRTEPGREATADCTCWTASISDTDEAVAACPVHRKATRSLRTRVVRLTWGGRDAHGSVPFDQKAAWQQGYDEAMRQVRHALDTIEQEDCDA